MFFKAQNHRFLSRSFTATSSVLRPSNWIRGHFQMRLHTQSILCFYFHLLSQPFTPSIILPGLQRLWGHSVSSVNLTHTWHKSKQQQCGCCKTTKSLLCLCSLCKRSHTILLSLSHFSTLTFMRLPPWICPPPPRCCDGWVLLWGDGVQMKRMQKKKKKKTLHLIPAELCAADQTEMEENNKVCVCVLSLWISAYTVCLCMKHRERGMDKVGSHVYPEFQLYEQ